jgi:hypothetical protein
LPSYIWVSAAVTVTPWAWKRHRSTSREKNHTTGLMVGVEQMTSQAENGMEPLYVLEFPMLMAKHG